MTELQLTLAKIQEQLEKGSFKNEQSISQGVVLPVLQNLGWDVFRTDIVCPEYTSGTGRVDYALCSPPGEPRCFIEVKQPGFIGKKIDDAVIQLMNYAFHSGSQFVVLTDGQTWSFYLPAEPGPYEERRVFMLDLFEHEADKAAEVLTRYLLEQDVKSGETLDRAKKDLHNAALRDKAKRELPSAWRDLVREQDPALIDRLANECESKTGVRPENTDVISFLEKLAYSRDSFDSSKKTTTTKKKPSPPIQGSQRGWNPDKQREESPQNKSHKFSYSLHGQEYYCSTMKEVLISVFTKLADEDPSFLMRCAENQKFVGQKRRYIARTKEQLYPGNPGLHSHVEHLPGGYLIGTNTNTSLKIELLKGACMVAGLIYGKDLKIRLPKN